MTLSARSSVAAAAVAACAVGLAGFDGGVLWVLAGVFTLRSLVPSAPGLAWGLACAGAGLRWGSLGMGDIEAATRLLGPTVMVGGPLVRIGMALALAGALADEAGRRSPTGGRALELVASVAAIVALVPLFMVEGPVASAGLAAAWGVAAALAAAAAVGSRPLVLRAPGWAPVAAVVVGLALAEVGR